MHKIDSPGATAGNEFTNGDPATNTPSTVLWAKWMNSLQRELINILTQAGVTPSDADDTQIFASLVKAFMPITVLADGQTPPNGARIIADNASADASYPLPAMPADGYAVHLWGGLELFSTYKVTFERNGNTIMGLAEDMDHDTDFYAITLIWVESLNTWKVFRMALAGHN